MKKFTYLLFLIIALAGCGKQAETQEEKRQKLANEIKKTFAEVKGDFALAYISLDNPSDSLLINAYEEFHAASTMKTPVMIEVYKQANEGKLNLDDSIMIYTRFKSIVDTSTFILDSSSDSEKTLFEKEGQLWPLRDVMYKMIIESSNLGTNLLVEMVDAKNITQTMRELGAPKINVLRGVEDIKAYRKGLSNSTTAYDLMKIFEGLGNGTVVNKDASEEMIDILLDQKYNEIIPAKLPQDVKVAHKTGWITGVHHDSALLMLPNGKKYVLVLLSKNLEDEAKGVEALATASKLLFDYVVSE
ncbi:serine hydrolase [Flexithrix dorotheae]|uniref:serine hydrolase n=1 Tax=Flexithrix dorotheae TaxID=70993 RepID=UPI000475640C|nr:serine hydrolase [Flexithrix dorotheae]